MNKSGLNTHRADLNELACGYILNGNRWWDRASRDQFNRKNRLLDRVVAEQVVFRGRAQAYKVLEYLTERGESIGEVHWCARKGTMPCATSKDHPADLFLKLSSGTWFGVSAKQTDKNYGDIGLKNPGCGSLCKLLGVNVKPAIQEAIREVVNRYSLPKAADARKASIRAAPEEVQKGVWALGDQLLGLVRTEVLQSLGDRPGAFLRTFLEQSLLDCDHAGTFPRYIKVTGYGDQQNGNIDAALVALEPQNGYRAELYDPFLVQLDGTITCEPIGTNSIGFRHNGEKVCKLRAKFASETLASSLKFAVALWEP
jgi:hypothetical protein